MFLGDKMKDSCCEKQTKKRDKTEHDLLIDRLNRISGQIGGIKQMIEDDRYCDDVLMQISAVNNSLKSLGLTLIDNHMRTCVKQSVISGDDTVLDEMIKTFERFAR